MTRRRDRQTGLNTVQFKLISVNEMTVDSAPFTVYNVELICDLSLTPWCQSKQSSSLKSSANSVKNAKLSL